MTKEKQEYNPDYDLVDPNAPSDEELAEESRKAGEEAEKLNREQAEAAAEKAKELREQSAADVEASTKKHEAK